VSDESKEFRELRGPDSSFPIDAQPIKRRILLDEEHLSAYHIAGKPGQCSFGMDRQRCADVLRDVADAIESGQYVLQGGGVYTQARRDDYVMTILNLKFHEKEK